MLSDREIVAFLEEQLAPDDLAQIELRFAKDFEALETLLAQQKMDCALRVHFSGDADEQRLCDEILSESGNARGETPAEVFANPLTTNSAQPLQKTRARFGKSAAWFGAAIGALAVSGGLYFAAQQRARKTTGSDFSNVENPRVHGGQRDWFRQPFASESPWNQPLTANAAYVQLAFGSDEIEGVAARRFVVSESEQAELRLFFSKEKVWKNLRLPASVDVSQFDDEPLCVVDLAREKVWVLQTLRVHGDQISAEKMSAESLRGSGFDFQNATGVLRRCSAIGGVIRGNELEEGIRHALAVSVDLTALRVENEAVAGAEKLQIGSRIAIPRNVDLRELGFGADSPKIARIAKALQTYGAYVVSDCSRSEAEFYFDQTVELPPDLNRALSKLILQTELVESPPLRGDRR